MKKNFQSTLGTIIFLFILIFWGCSHSNSDLNNFTNAERLPGLKNGKLIQVSSYDTTGANNDRINIPVGKTATIADLDGPGLIARIWITIDSRDPHFLRRILLRMYWDGEENPSVEVPVGDFFGTGFEYKHYFSQYLGMTSGGYFCYFPMPFNKAAKIEVVNETGQEIYAFYYHIDYYQLEKPLNKSTAYFHSFWKRDILTDYPENYTILEAEGEGHIVGLNMSMQSYNRSLGFLEGDEMIWVDGEMEPSIYGTGTEDYFTSGWYFKDGEFASPYHGLILKDQEEGRIAAYRLHVPDPIPFKKSVKFTMEHGHANESYADFSSTVYWYQKEPHKAFPPIMKSSLRIPLRVIIPPGGYEAEDAGIDSEFPHKITDMTDFGPEWSGGKQLFFELDYGQELNLNIDGLEEKLYDIDLYYTKGPEYGKVKVYQNDQLLEEFDGLNDHIFPGGKIALRNLLVENGKITLRFLSSENENMIGLDVLILKPVRKYIPEWMVIGPFINKRDSDILRYGIDSIYPPEKHVDLNAVYKGVDGKDIIWKRFQTPPSGYFSLWDKVDPYEFVISYAFTYVYSPKDISVPFFIGSDDGSKVFLNGKEIYRFLDVRVSEPDQDTIELALKKGWNELLLKIENNFGGYSFYSRIRDNDNKLKYSLNPALAE